MKQIIFSLCVVFSSGLMAQSLENDTRMPPKDLPQVGTKTDNSAAGSGSTAMLKCCPRIYFSAPAAKPGSKATTRLVSGNLFKGQNRGQDLSFELLNAKGQVVSGLDEAIQKNNAGDLVIDGSKLPNGQKMRLRVKSGKAVESYVLN